MSIKERLREVMLFNNMNMKCFSKTCSIPYRSLQNYLLGERTVGTNALIKINTHFGVNTNWLLTGKGQMFLNEKQEKDQDIPKWFTNWWQHADDEHKHWLKIQLKNTK